VIFNPPLPPFLRVSKVFVDKPERCGGESEWLQVVYVSIRDRDEPASQHASRENKTADK